MLTLVNYRHSSSAPLKSITQLPEREAFEVAKALSARSECFAHRRFGADFPMYYEHRLRTEEWLYAQFVELGGAPETRHPYYFALERCESLKRNFECGQEIRLPLDIIDDKHVSFTYGDSVAVMNEPIRKPPFLKAELLARIDECGGDVNAFLSAIYAPYKLIEAQIWTDKYFTQI